MIVHCTSCQAKFRIADDKIGPRGAKARCSRCQTVFAVHRDLGAMALPDSEPRPARPSDDPPPEVERPTVTGGRAPLDVELERPERAAGPTQVADPFAFEPPPERAGATRADEHDPFAAAGQPAGDADPFGWTLQSPPAHEQLGASDDPFEARADPFAPPGESADAFPPAASYAEPDPFAGGAGADPFGVAAADPFAAPAGDAPAFEPGPSWPARPDPAALLAQAAEPFAEAPSPTASRRLPLTDLSDLLGDGPGPSARPATPRGEMASPPAGPDLTLEDRTTPPAFRAPSLARDLSLGGAGAPEPVFGGGSVLALETGPAFGFGSPDLELAGGASPRQRLSPALEAEPSGPLALATEPTPPAAASPPSRPPPLPTAVPAARAVSALAALDALAAPEVTAAPDLPVSRPPVPRAAREHPARPRSMRLPALAVNAVALAALLAIALAMLVVWRGGRLEVAAFHPAAIVNALRHGTAGPFVTAAVRSGLYERERGAPLLFVRGDVVSRAQAAVRSVRVAVEVVREGTVVARGEALAGAVPTPEELWRARSADALARVARRAAARAPERIGPGDEVPFLVAIDEFPQELAGTVLRISVAPEEDRER